VTAQEGKKSRKKHIPQRTCIVCHTTGDKRTLTRLVRTPDAGVQVDPTGKQPGRGAYLCDNPDCWQQAVQTQVAAEALRTNLTDEDRQRLAAAAPGSDTKDLAI
jgi:hypothetical protein